MRVAYVPNWLLRAIGTGILIGVGLFALAVIYDFMTSVTY